MAWCLFSNRVSTATVVGNSYLQMVTCKYLIFCSLDKYKLLVPHQVCAFAQERLIELKSTLVGTLEAWLTLGHAPLNSHRCCPTAVPSLVEQLPCISIQTAEIGLKFGGRTPDGTPHACPVPAVLTKAYIHAHTHFAKKGYFFNGKRKFSKSRKGGGFYFLNFGKLNSHSLITQHSADRPIKLSGSHRTQTQTSEVSWLHAPMVTEWWPACLHKQSPRVHQRGN